MAAVTICIRKMQIKTTEVLLHTYQDGKNKQANQEQLKTPKQSKGK